MEMEAIYKLGDRFARKNTRDNVALEVVRIYHEPVYELKPIALCGECKIIGQEALIELYNQVPMETANIKQVTINGEIKYDVVDGFTQRETNKTNNKKKTNKQK